MKMKRLILKLSVARYHLVCFVLLVIMVNALVLTDMVGKPSWLCHVYQWATKRHDVYFAKWGQEIHRFMALNH